MKTEQEQIKAIKKIIDERVETTLGYVQGRHGNVIKTVDTVIIARDIVEAGYGDVSEYKAEIERLKAERNDYKQAKIDVLNKVKKRIYDISPYNPIVTKDNVKYFIDELIEEVQNAEDKG